MSLDDRDEGPAARSRDSTRPARRPRDAASSAAPAPVIPPPMTSTSSGSAASACIAESRLRASRTPGMDESSFPSPPRDSRVYRKQLGTSSYLPVNKPQVKVMPRRPGDERPPVVVLVTGLGRRSLMLVRDERLGDRSGECADGGGCRAGWRRGGGARRGPVLGAGR